MPPNVSTAAAAIAYAIFGLGAWIQSGGVMDKAAMESEASAFTGDGGFPLHGINGEIVFPVLVLILLGALLSGPALLDDAVDGVEGEQQRHHHGRQRGQFFEKHGFHRCRRPGMRPWKSGPPGICHRSRWPLRR